MALANSNLLTLQPNASTTAFTSQKPATQLYSGPLTLSGSPQVAGLSAADQAAVNKAYQQGMTPTNTTLNPYGQTQTSTPMAAIQGSAPMTTNTGGTSTSPMMGALSNAASSVYGNQYTNNPSGYNPSAPIQGLVSPTKPTPQPYQPAPNAPIASTGTASQSQQSQPSSGGLYAPGYVPPPTSSPSDMTLVYDKTTGQPTYVNTANLSMNMDRYSTTPISQPGTNPATSGATNQSTTQGGTTGMSSFGTPTADTSSYKALIQQAADAQAAARNFNQNLSNAEIAVTQTGNDLPFQTGAQAGLQRQYGAQAQALSTAAQNATQLAGLVAPQLAGYNQQAFNPLTQQFSGGGSLQDAVNGVVQKLQSGQMSYNDALTALSGYGQSGVNALQQSLPPGFNIAQSNALAGQQGSIGPAYTYAKTALSNLQNAVGNLGTGQNTNIPIINQITQGIATTFGIGSQAVQAYKGALAEARSAIQKVLASVQGGTPTDYVGQSNALLPDNATPAQINAAQQTLDTLGQAKVSIYGNPGQSSTQSSGTTGSSIWSW